jgi:hypothetical protein
MKNHLIKYVTCGIVFLATTSCRFETSSTIRSSSESNFEYKTKSETSGNKSVITESNIKISSKKESFSLRKSRIEFSHSEKDKGVRMFLDLDFNYNLEVGKPFKISFITNNINEKNFIVSGSKIKVDRIDEEKLSYEITLIEENLGNGVVEIKVAENIQDNENFTHEFLVPVKMNIK